MAPRNPTDVRRLLLVSALTAGLCYLALVLAYAAYRAYFDWLGESVSRETRNAIKSIFPWSVVAFGTLFVLAYLTSMRFARISRPYKE